MPTRAIKAIFFTRFHYEKGSRVLHQVPEGSITPSSSPSALSTPLIPFSSITSYLIPTQQFCDRLLTFCTNHYRVIGYPVCIREGKYSRNEFIFNFAVVIEEGVGDWVAYGEVVRKMGKLLRGLEEQGGFLSREEVGMGIWDDDEDKGWQKAVAREVGWDQGPVGGGSKVYALCEMILEDLNNYCECMIPIDDSNTINFKLFPTHPPPPPIHPYQVPLLTISLSSLTSPISSDLTLIRIIPFINGIHSVSHIAQLADTDISLTRKAIQHLVYYGCVLLLDIFSFGAVYAPTAEIGGFVTDKGVGEECARYVRVPRVELGRGSGGIQIGSGSEKSRDERSSLSSEPQRNDITSTATAMEFDSYARRGEEEDCENISHETLIGLYTSLRQGLTLKSWVLENLDLLAGIDVRRLITFGVIKGFLYRVHRYAISTASSLPPPPLPPTSLLGPNAPTNPSNNNINVKNHDSDTATLRPLTHKPSMASTTFVPRDNGVRESGLKHHDKERLDSLLTEERDALPLVRFLDGMHCFDEMCTELGLGEKAVEEKIKRAGEVAFLWR
ncbi:nitrogen permease regulator 2 [Lindgomyces ingoldianus]|uniref:Nitrogen permease regulator 2 n=1 Tax=Lindgomyces ingoldianus TaxID=673940 RepID=A0ACB6QVG1_9PLEO|nr:nitrogen permease regulator 2 [Lindgomyces ingoldianus]KAF2471009.1 nitrogen permease regulator 2 [Lindgomyces ingoldianus]